MSSPKELAVKACDAALTTAVQTAISKMFETYGQVDADPKRDTYQADAVRRLSAQLTLLGDAYKRSLDAVQKVFNDPEAQPAQRERRKTG